MKKLLIASLLLGSTATIAAPFVIQDIRIDGIQSGMDDNVLSSLPVRIGQKATDNDIANVVRTLFLRGYENVRATREGNTLLISVQQRPIISEVVLEGNDSIPSEAIKENLNANGFAIGNVLDRDKLEAFRQSMLDHYRSVGRYNATIETIITPIANNGAELKLKFKENDVALLKDIKFEGNKAFSAGKLEEQMQLQSDAWWKFFGNKFDSVQFGKDLEALRNFYLENGYVKFQISGTDVQLNEDKTEARVRIAINEGEQYRVTNVRIVGDVGGMSEELEPLLKKIRMNDTYRVSDVSYVENAIKAKLGEQGYATSTVNISPQFNENDNTMSITFVVDAGRRYSVRQIRFEGNTVSADKTLRQEMRQQEGTWLSSQLVELGKLRLERTGFLKQ